MPTNFNGLRGTVEVLRAIETRVKALKLANGEKAFETVEIFNVADLDLAIRTFIAARSRVAFIVFDGDDFETDPKSEGTELNQKQSRKIDVLIGDRVISQDRTKALLGTGDDHPGALGLMDLVESQLPGLLFPNPKGVYLECLGSETAMLSDTKQKDHPGRVGVLVRFDARGGLLTKQLDKAGIK